MIDIDEGEEAVFPGIMMTGYLLECSPEALSQKLYL